MTIDPELIEKIGLFAGCGVVGMIFGYYRRWSYDKQGIGLFNYMFGDGHAVGRAITTLIILCAGAGSFDYLDNLTVQQIIVAGAGLGLLVPEKADKEKNA